MAILPSPPPVELLALAVLCYMAGAVTPYYYMMERLRGFGRRVSNAIPYAPPPGEDPGKAMQDAVEAGERTPDDDSDAE